jgi:integrase
MSAYGDDTRRPVVHGGARIPGLYERVRKDGATVYEYRVRIDGRMTRGTIADALTRSDAVRDYRRLLSDRDYGVQRENRLLNPTVAEVVDEWLAALQARVGINDDKRRLAQSTVVHYRSGAHAHVVPLLGHVRVAEVTWRDVRRLVERMSAKGLAPATISHAVKTITGALAFAQTSDYVDRNVARDLPHEYRPGSKRITEPRYLTRGELDRLLQHAPDRYRPAWALCAYAGLRISEALALEWRHIDFKDDTLTVCQQVGRGRSPGPGALAPRKTQASAATVPMLPTLKRELLAHRGRLAEQDLQRVRPDALLFLGDHGELIGSRRTWRVLGTAAKRAGLNPPGLPPVGQHDLRHTCAALAFEAGASVVEVAELMRHADPSITLTTYAGLTSEGRGGAARKMIAAGIGA